jgi:transcriptional regulator with GAF, ATPase, and Fis domain
MNQHDAFLIIQNIAAGRDPFSEGSVTTNRPENNPDTVKALCIALAALANSSPNPLATEMKTHFEETLSGKLSLEEASQLYEKETITKVLEQTRHNQAEAARRLGITYRALRYKIDQYGIG